MNSQKVGGRRKQVMSNANWHAIMKFVKSSVEQMENWLCVYVNSEKAEIQVLFR